MCGGERGGFEREREREYGSVISCPCLDLGLAIGGKSYRYKRLYWWQEAIGCKRSRYRCSYRSRFSFRCTDSSREKG